MFWNVEHNNLQILQWTSFSVAFIRYLSRCLVFRWFGVVWLVFHMLYFASFYHFTHLHLLLVCSLQHVCIYRKMIWCFCISNVLLAVKVVCQSEKQQNSVINLGWENPMHADFSRSVRFLFHSRFGGFFFWLAVCVCMPGFSAFGSTELGTNWWYIWFWAHFSLNE